MFTVFHFNFNMKLLNRFFLLLIQAGLIICISQDRDVDTILNRLNQLEMRVKHLEDNEKNYEKRISGLEDVLKQKDEILSKFRNYEKSENSTISDQIQTAVLDSINNERKRFLVPYAISQTAFHVRLGRDITSINIGQIIVFDHVVLNTRNAYSTADGEFTAPVTGIYLFYWNLLTNGVSQMDTTLSSTQGVLGYGYVDKGYQGFANGGNMVIVKLNEGTRVWLNKADTYGQFLHERFSTFSGFLLSETN